MPLPALAPLLARLGPMLARGGGTAATGARAGSSAGGLGGMNMKKLAEASANMPNMGGGASGGGGDEGGDTDIDPAGGPLKALGSVKAKFQKAGAHLNQAVHTERAFSAGGQGMRALGEFNPLAKFGAAAMESVDKLRDFSSTLHIANSKFAEFSGSMSRVVAMQEMRDALLSRERGERRAESADKLAQARHRFEQAVTPFDDAWANIKNQVTAMLLDNVATPIIKKISALLEWLGIALPQGEGDDPQAWLKDIEDAYEASRPKRFK